MKVILEFELPDEKNEFLLAVKGADYWNCLWELNQDCRTKTKYSHTFKDADEALEYVRKYILYRVDLEEIE